MKIIPEAEYDRLVAGATLLESDRHGPKVYLTPAQTVLKLFRTKRRLSSNLWSPFAKRFAKNAAGLRAAGLLSLEVLEIGRVPHIARQLVVYRLLPGQSLRQALRDLPAGQAAALMEEAGRFIDEVQRRGVFFRSFHFGNILVTPEGGFALIDVLDVWFKRSSLGLWRRRRNLRHLTRYAEDRAALFTHWEAFQKGYLSRAAGGEPGPTAEELAKLLDRRRGECGNSVPVP